MSKISCYRNLFPENHGGGGEEKAGHKPLLQQCVFIVMQISSCNLGQVQVHPVLVAVTETRMSSLFLISHNTLLSCAIQSVTPQLVMMLSFFHISRGQPIVGAH